jgi:hypothetical protein
MPDEPRFKPVVNAEVSVTEGKGPRKGSVAPPPRRVRGKIKMKETTRTSKAKKGAVKSGATGPLQDQTTLKRAPRPEGYVRFRVHVDNGEATIVDSHLVESTLVQQPALHGNFVYEVIEGDKILHVDSIPDLGVFRSFVNPEGPPEQRRHHIYELATYDFDIRVPVTRLTQAALPRVTIVLHRVKDGRWPLAVGAVPLSTQYQQELREVTRVEGIPASVLPATLRRGTRKPK